MKKYFFLILLSIFLLVPVGAKAETFKDGTLVTSENYRQYFDEKFYYSTVELYNGNKYCFEHPIGSNPYMWCIDEENFNKISRIEYLDTGYYQFHLSSAPLKSSYVYKIDANNNYVAWSWSKGSQQLYLFNKVSYFNFNFTNPDGTVFESNWGGNPVLFYDIIFDIPNNVSLIVKDSDGNIVESENNTYHLEVGIYTYTITSELYETIEETFSVSEETTIKPELLSKFKTENIDNLFTNFYLILKNMTLKIFNLEQPLFLIGAGIILLFSVILLLKKILGGR